MKDFLSQDIAIGDYVSALYSEDKTPAIFEVVGFTPKKVRLIAIGSDGTTLLKFNYDILVIDPAAVEYIIKQEPKDKLGQDLEVGDFVFASGGNFINPVAFKITGFRPTIALLEKVYGAVWSASFERYTQDLVKINPALVTMHLLKR